MQLSEWEYDTAWSRIITKNNNGLQDVAIDQVEFKKGLAIVKKANIFIKMKNIMSRRY